MVKQVDGTRTHIIDPKENLFSSLVDSYNKCAITEGMSESIMETRKPNQYAQYNKQRVPNTTSLSYR